MYVFGVSRLEVIICELEEFDARCVLVELCIGVAQNLMTCAMDPESRMGSESVDCILPGCAPDPL